MTPNALKRAIWTRLAGLVAGYTVTGATPDEVGGVYSPAMQTTSELQPFRSLHHFAGEVSRSLSDARENGLALTHLKQVPAMLLAWEGTRPVGANGSRIRTILQEGEVIRQVQWRVYVAVTDPRGDAWAMDTALVGIDAVEGALAELRIAGLYDGGGITWEESAPWITARRASYVSVVRFSAQLALDTTANETALEPDAEPFETMTGENGPEGATDLDPSTIDLTD
ncbi:MAG: hypothetical protein Q8S73_26530 [Deltaproteobacteria bacterium]|nr:hypothetical protein [Myxococcales bacterium]MDP3217692.1 hypothetical protein [Deltaproteobacteria bacterium]